MVRDELDKKENTWNQYPDTKPELQDRVLTYSPSNQESIELMTYEYCAIRDEYHFCYIEGYMTKGIDPRITHWKHLPDKPYKGKENDF